MTTKQLKSVGSDDIDEFSSIYTDDFETDSPPLSPNDSYQPRKTSISNDKTTESDASSFSGHRKQYSHKVQKTNTSKLKSGKTGPRSSGKKNTSPVKTDVIQTRMLSAQRSRINTLNNELGEMQNKLQELVKENKLLKKLQFRQEKSLRRFENKDGDIPRLITQYEDDQKVLKAKLRKSQESEKALESKLRESNEEIFKLEHSMQKLKKLVDDKSLGERSELTKQLNYSQDRLFDCEKKNSETEKKLELSTQSFTRQLHGEKSKHIETKEKLRILQEKLEELENRLKEKNRALEVSNIYSLRARHNQEKTAVNSKTSSARRSPKKSDQEINKSKPSQQSPCQQANDKPLSAASAASIEHYKLSAQTDLPLGNVESSSSENSSRESSGKSVRQLSDNLDGLKLNRVNCEINGTDHERKDSASFLKSSKSIASTLSDNANPSPPSTQESGILRTTLLLREKSFTVTSKDEKKKEEHEEKKGEDEKKKAALLARMRDVDEAGGDVTSTGSDLQKLLNGPAQKPVMHHKRSTENLGKDHNGLENGDDSELTFGGYAPTVTSVPKRKLQSRMPGTDSDKPLLDLNSTKPKNNDLLQQLFGNAGSRPSSNDRNKKNSFTSTLPKATPLVSSNYNGSGDVDNVQHKDTAARNCHNMPTDEELEEMRF